MFYTFTVHHYYTVPHTLTEITKQINIYKKLNFTPSTSTICYFKQWNNFPCWMVMYRWNPLEVYSMFPEKIKDITITNQI